MITQDELKKVINYNPETGVFIWLAPPGRRMKKGDIAGYVDKTKGYRKIVVNGKQYRASVLAWIYMKGIFPKKIVDHINRIRDDDRFCNLREISKRGNNINSCIGKGNNSGIKGVRWVDKKGYWESQITINREFIYLGSYKDKTDAAIARLDAEIKYGFFKYIKTSTAEKYLLETDSIILL